MNTHLPPTWNLNGLILEGIAGSGKSTALRALLAHPAWTEKPFLSSIVLSEHQTMRVLEAKEREEGLQIQDHLELLDDIVGMLERFKRRLARMDWAERQREGHKLPYLFERFHLSHMYHYPGMAWEAVQPIDERLCLLNAKVCILTLGKEHIHRRVIGDTRKQWQPYLQQIGGTAEEIVSYFSRQQDVLLEISALTQLPCRIIDTSEKPVENIVAEILDFWRIGT